MKKVTMLFALVLMLMTQAACSQTVTTPVKANGRLSVDNGRVVNEHGNPPQLRGISMSWSIWQGQKYYNPEVISWLCTDFKASVIRVSMAVEPKGGYLQDSARQLQLITTVTDQAIRKGAYVLIDWHDHHANKNIDKARQFFAMMAKRYKGTPNVIYEIWNEPERVSWAVVKDYAVEIIKTIRKFDAENLIIVGSPHWDQDVDIASADPITGFKNIAYSFHFYASDPYHQQKLCNRANMAIKNKLPLFVTEWGVGEADGNGVFDKGKTDVWLKWLEDNRLSWTNWNVTDKNETTALLKPGAAISANWKEQHLTPAGIYIRLKLRSLNKTNNID
ncbi:glycoside hydrolase family 5 protein [Mucilaginibacter sp. UR6-1]|uniref:glycoside hydrolase family 5 protein n=1 Tax=Mucilaginibacter sp. UR6-1 TaxID=1435643 RepID=UPI001E3D20ED|nr:glycoside hydrolase family 5 protein [Mucilaginibacter sp. UR6-1]MCC8409769.1 glycoside hydrolase family 5 protein [Mucilaginibacter sp. UR6-1]